MLDHLSPYIKKLVQSSNTINNIDAWEAESVVLIPSILIRTTLPHSQSNERFYERKDGKLCTTFADTAGVGLPYGTFPRYALSWLITEAKLNNCPRVYLGKSMKQFLKSLETIKNGGDNGGLGDAKKQIRSLCSCSITHHYIGNNEESIESRFITDKQHYWWSSEGLDELPEHKSFIQFSDDFFNEIVTNSVPVDFRVLRLLSRSPMSMDIYCWLTWRLFKIKSPTRVPLRGLWHQFGHGYVDSKKGRNNFQSSFKHNLAKVLILYPDAKVDLTPGYVRLRPSPPHVKQKE